MFDFYLRVPQIEKRRPLKHDFVNILQTLAFLTNVEKLERPLKHDFVAFNSMIEYPPFENIPGATEIWTPPYFRHAVVVSTISTLEAFHCTNDMHVTMVYCDLSSTMSHTVLLGRESFTWVPNTKKDLSQRNHIMPSPLASILTLEGTKNALNVTN